MTDALSADQFAGLLGKPASSAELRAYVGSLGVSPSISHFDGERTYYEFDSIGLELVFDEDKLSGAHYLGPETESPKKPYGGTLPAGLKFTDSKDDVLKKLGAPFESKAGIDDPRPFVGMKPLVKYRLDTYFLCIQFTQREEQINQITLQS